MRAVIQRVKRAEVRVECETVGKIGQGLLVLLCVMESDEEEDILYISRKIPEMRIFADAQGKINLNVFDVKGEILLISQFTLAARTKKGNRPSFIDAAKPAKAVEFMKRISDAWQAQNIEVEQGQFGAMMEVELINDGPVTIWIDSQNRE